MKFVLFPGCKIPYYLPHYGSASKVVLQTLGVELIEPEFNCCGYPSRSIHFKAFLLTAARNMAIAREHGLPMVTPCKCCFGTFKHADHWLRESARLRDEVNEQLSEENLGWEEGIEVKHLLTVLTRDVGLEAIRERITNPFKGVKIAAHYGCHALRPSLVTNFDDPLSPSIFENLVEVTGAECVGWSRRLECCGNPLWGKNDRLSLELMSKKITDARQAGAAYLCAACTYCQIQFDQIQGEALMTEEAEEGLPSILYPQLLGLSLGLSEEALGLKANKMDLSGVLRFMT